MKTKTYSNKKGEEYINWFEFLNKKNFTSEELENARCEAANWPTCACGNQCAVIPRTIDGEPVDRILSKYGYEFAEYLGEMHSYGFGESNEIFERNRKKALHCFEKIEARSFKLLLEMNVIVK